MGYYGEGERMLCPSCGEANSEAFELCQSCGAGLGAEDPQPAPTRTGLAQNKAAALSYLLGWITGLIFIKLEKDNDYVRFHAVQSIITFGGLTWATAVAFSISLLLIEIPNVGVIVWFLWVLLPLWSIPIGVFWIYLMIKAYRGNRYKLRWVGNLAERYL
jgi:uncharacterized membrane protein